MIVKSHNFGSVSEMIFITILHVRNHKKKERILLMAKANFLEIARRDS